MEIITYFLIALSTSVIGSFLGIGGGVILLPILLLMGVSQGTAAFSSALTVFTMAIFTCSIYYKRKQGNVGLALKIAITSIPTTFVGAMVNQMLPEVVYRFLYGALIVALLLLMVWKKKRQSEQPHFLSKYRIMPYLFGIIIGFLAGLFGIGGGPIVIPILLLIFMLNQKTASATSSYVTLLTSFASIASYAIIGGSDFSIGIYMIPGAILGAIIGTHLNKLLDEKWIAVLFNLLLVVLFALNLIKI
ncbi:sulfite exporter TauE/SafE family protein [Listeria sp. FSL L7-1517]|uniref:sulfite exporter TauE/SafE family protein n=1 Tax=Listeria immobilis TaxID=2713502 RepID=UPI00164E1A01|nr:sulfite exporter TauE/SafE family protein [Listeria immobilis]MBC6296343.1 sulfite exporter TauE/SafE family protein [Listeria immobilis]